MAKSKSALNLTQTEQKLLEFLKNLGFGELERVVYLAALKAGPASVWDISYLSGIKRPTCYVVLDQLVERGHGSVSFDGRRAIYSVLKPFELLAQAKTVIDTFSESLPELETISSKVETKPVIRMYEGREGIRQAYELSLKLPEGSSFEAYGNPEVLQTYPEMIDLYIKRRVARKIKARVIIPEGPLQAEVAKRDKTELRETRALPKDKFMQMTEVNILPNAIIYIAHSESHPFATVIESRTLAGEERQRFEFLWGMAKEIQA